MRSYWYLVIFVLFVRYVWGNLNYLFNMFIKDLNNILNICNELIIRVNGLMGKYVVLDGMKNVLIFIIKILKWVVV